MHLEQHVYALVRGVFAAGAQRLADVLDHVGPGHVRRKVVAKGAEAPAAQVGRQVDELFDALDHRPARLGIGRLEALAGGQTRDRQPCTVEQCLYPAALGGSGLGLDAVFLPCFAAEFDAVEPVGRKQRQQVIQGQVGADRIGVQAQFHLLLLVVALRVRQSLCWTLHSKRRWFKGRDLER